MISHHRVLSMAGSSRGQRGETLVELIITVVIMAISLGAVTLGIITMVRTSDQHRRSVRASNEAMTIAELIDAMPYVACGSNPSYFPPPGYTTPTNFTVTVTRQNLVSRTATTPTFANACPAGGDQGAQQLTVRVTKSDPGSMSVSEQVVIVKRQ